MGTSPGELPNWHGAKLKVKNAEIETLQYPGGNCAENLIEPSVKDSLPLELSIVIPAFNEEGRLAESLKRIREYFERPLVAIRSSGGR